MEGGENNNHSENEDDEEDYIKDPFESFNRGIFIFNRGVDKLVMRPLATIYDTILPRPAKTGLRNFFSNLMAPLDGLNRILQGNGGEAMKSIWSFLVNTTFGFFGLFDVSGAMGIDKKKTTFNETLAKWNIEPGPYLVLPLLGPSSFRGAIGFTGDWIMDPWRLVVNNKTRSGNKHGQQQTFYYVLRGLDLIRKRSEIESWIRILENDSFDLYMAVRNAYVQQQQGLINGEGEDDSENNDNE